MKKVVAIAAFISIMGILFFLTMERATMNHSLFSWDSQVLNKEESETLFQTMEKYRLVLLAQYIPPEIDPELMKPFFKQASEHKISVYLLAGEASWGLDPTGAEMIATVQRAARIRETLDSDHALVGIMMDTEPYLTNEWKQDRAGVMTDYVSAMTAAYAEAQKAGLKLTVCIPYFYDTEGLDPWLEQLISQCCDGVAVMNYYEGREAEHMQTELALAKRYEKPLTTIYELQPPGVYDLEEKNTYYDNGLSAVFESYAAVKRQLSDGSISYGLHNYAALLDLMKREGS